MMFSAGPGRIAGVLYHHPWATLDFAAAMAGASSSSACRWVKRGFEALDVELSGHADPIHRNLERDISKLKKDVEALKGRSARTTTRTPRRRQGTR